MSTKDVEGRTRLDEAKQRAREIVDSTPRNAKAAIIAFDDSGDTVQTFTTDQQLLRNAIDSIRSMASRSGENCGGDVVGFAPNALTAIDNIETTIARRPYALALAPVWRPRISTSTSSPPQTGDAAPKSRPILIRRATGELAYFPRRFYSPGRSLEGRALTCVRERGATMCFPAT